MDTNKTALNQCLELSQNINKLGLGINSKRAACELFTCLVQSSANLGAAITAVDYIPSRECRLGITLDAMKEISKIIYLLNVANGSDMFIANEVADAIESAIKVSELLNAILAEYSKPVQPYAQPATAQSEEWEEDEEGFDEPFNG